ncbi:MAG: lysophospholipid acyltransferase family protein [Malacoplasma sp.]
MKKIILLLRHIGHFLFFPFVSLYLLILIKQSKGKYLTYEAEGEEVKDEERYNYVFKMVKALLYLANFKISFENDSTLPKKPLFFVANHKSEYDPLFFLKFFYLNTDLTLPIFVAKKEIEDNKNVSYAAKLIDSIFIDRNNLRDIYNGLLKQKEVIVKKSVIIFPEGTRHFDDEIHEFKSAAFEAAYSTHTTIVPVCIYSEFKETNSKKDFFKYKKIVFKILEPIKSKDYISFTKDSLANKVQSKITNQYETLKTKSKIL